MWFNHAAFPLTSTKQIAQVYVEAAAAAAAASAEEPIGGIGSVWYAAALARAASTPCHASAAPLETALALVLARTPTPFDTSDSVDARKIMRTAQQNKYTANASNTGSNTEVRVCVDGCSGLEGWVGGQVVYTLEQDSGWRSGMFWKHLGF